MPGSSPYRGLRLLVFQVRPLTIGNALDGAQAVLVDVLRHFSRLGVETTVLCGRQPGLSKEYEPIPGVVVRPVLRFNEDGQDPYQVPPYQLAESIQRLRQATHAHDVLYIHDCNLRFDFVGTDLPTVAAVFDLVYTHSVAGAVGFGRDRLVTTEYVGACLREVFQGFRPLPPAALTTVDSGFSTDTFRFRDPTWMRARIGLPDDAIAVLHPHRPEPAKGLREALATIRQLRSRLPAADYGRVRLLVPVWLPVSWDDARHRPDKVYPEAFEYAVELGVADKLCLHPAVPRARMAEYYSAGAATLCIGTFPEAFGNVHVESMLCGTPAILSRVAAHRTTVPEELVRKVDPGEVEAAAEQLAEVIGRRERTGAALLEQLAGRYAQRRMLRGFERALLECKQGLAIPLTELPGSLSLGTRLRIPPWAARLHSGYYHDFSGYCDDPTLLASLPRVERGWSVGELTSGGAVTIADVQRWLSDGWVVSDPKCSI
jgi:glycosyltransferase involved in cell wall biosynthesis